MERFITGDIVIVPFPFTDLSATRKRPALVLAHPDGDDVILCEITSKKRNDKYVVHLDNTNLETGNLKVTSIIRPNRMLTLHRNKILYKLGSITKPTLEQVRGKIKHIFKL